MLKTTKVKIQIFTSSNLTNKLDEDLMKQGLERWLSAYCSCRGPEVSFQPVPTPASPHARQFTASYNSRCRRSQTCTHVRPSHIHIIKTNINPKGDRSVHVESILLQYLDSLLLWALMLQQWVSHVAVSLPQEHSLGQTCVSSVYFPEVLADLSTMPFFSSEQDLALQISLPWFSKCMLYVCAQAYSIMQCLFQTGNHWTWAKLVATKPQWSCLDSPSPTVTGAWAALFLLAW